MWLPQSLLFQHFMTLISINLGDSVLKIDILILIIQSLTILNRDRTAITMTVKMQINKKILSLEDLSIFHLTEPY